MSDAPRTTQKESLFTALSRALAGQFTIERELGRGGMGVVYLAHDVRLDRPVALKVLPGDLAADPLVRERFIREARTAARLAHPHIVPVYRADEIDGIAFFTMGYVDGESLGDRVRDRGALAPVEAVRVLREVAWALAYAHARGVVHRDVKPENVLLERSGGRALVSDFGIARRTDDAPAAARLTNADVVMGTLHYMSPEQVAGEPLDGRSDLYALGVVAFHVLSGRLPFDGLAGTAVLLAHATRPAPPLASVAPAVPPSLAAVVDRCLSKRAEDRYPTGEALADALEQALAEAPAATRAHEHPFATDLPNVVSEAHAAAIWRRAAQLQADALNRLEARRELQTRAQRRPAAPTLAGSVEGGETDTTSDKTSAEGATSYALSHVIAAAQEAGISSQYVAMAVAELPRRGEKRLGAPGMNELANAGIGERQAMIFLGSNERSIAVSHIVPANPSRTLRALGVALQQPPFELRLRETVGAHPLDGGVIVFDLPGPIVGVMNASAATAGAFNPYWMATHQQLEASQLHITLRPLPGAPQRTELTVTCDVRRGVRGNIRVSKGLGGVLGGMVGFGTGAVFAKGAAVVASAAVMGPAVAVGLGTLALTMLIYRSAYPGVLTTARREMLGALEAVSAAVQSEEVFGVLPGPGRPPQSGGGGDGGGDSFVIGI